MMERDFYRFCLAQTDRLSKKGFMKKLIFLVLLLPALTFAKEYKVKITPCDKSSNCTKCYEQVDLTYSVDEKFKTVTLSGFDEKGSFIKDTIKECTVNNANNWSCSGAFVRVDVKNGVLSMLNNPENSLANAGKEVCRLR
jgi:hypothetical protein